MAKSPALTGPAQEGRELFVTVLLEMEVERLTAHVVENYPVVVDTHFEVRKVKIIDGRLREALPIADGVIGEIPDSPAEESISMVCVLLQADVALNSF